MITWGFYMGLIIENQCLRALSTYSGMRIFTAVWPGSPSEDIYQSYYRVDQSHPIVRYLLSRQRPRSAWGGSHFTGIRVERRWPCGWYLIYLAPTRIRIQLKLAWHVYCYFHSWELDCFHREFEHVNCPEYSFNWLPLLEYHKAKQ